MFHSFCNVHRATWELVNYLSSAVAVLICFVDFLKVNVVLALRLSSAN